LDILYLSKAALDEVRSTRFCEWKSWTDARVPKSLASLEDGRQTAFSRLTFRRLVDSAELLTATEATSDLVFDPRCLGGDKSLACLYRTASVILFQSREFDHCLVQALSQFCINSTSIYPEHPAPPELF
jgi:hypothetical protein